MFWQVEIDQPTSEFNKFLRRAFFHSMTLKTLHHRDLKLFCQIHHVHVTTQFQKSGLSLRVEGVALRINYNIHLNRFTEFVILFQICINNIFFSAARRGASL